MGPQAVEPAGQSGPAPSGDLTVPVGAVGLVVFAHGSGSSRLSPRNRTVAHQLRSRRLGTLLIDLLDADEERRDARTAELRFDIDLLAERVVDAVDGLADEPAAAGLPVGLFGASTGAAAALVAAARRPREVRAVVSRGGRADLAGDHLPHVTAPTLLVVGGDDHAVIDLNRRAARRLTTNHRIEIVPGAGHLFAEPGALDLVADLAASWFVRHLPVAA